MHLPSFGKCVDGAVDQVLLDLLKSKMFGSGTKRWFVKKQKRQYQRPGRRPCTRKKKRWAAKILKKHRQKILSELDVNTVLPHLVYDKVFSLGEYKEILGTREVCPHLLTSFLLDEKEGDPGQGRNGGLPVPPNGSAEPPLFSPPMYTDAVFKRR
ncbi:hypothetical protein KUCAC02_021824 [Chaenocephalus aceratus]|uniref:Uncharacterized protein n=1 Tax=Chaenocephalus aceratus TaxID=36190 RepID=A0ACB9XHK1_CHAAC|nr:hypothetical protein KUCAC02_021824 [Chaenocephalus aceratus]